VSLDGIGVPTVGLPETWAMMAQRTAHALRNPLTHMLLTVQRLQTEYRERAPAVASRLDPYAERIVQGIGQLRRLTSSFLKVVDVTELELRECDLNRLVAGFCEALASRLPPDIRLRVETAARSPHARVDDEELEVALDNLIANAVNAMEEGGTLTVATSDARAVRLEGTDSPADYVQLEVMDTGCGIPPHLRERLFEPGVTTRDEGSGLGLAIVRKIVGDHGGHITLQSEVGVGTVFTIHLPAEPVRHDRLAERP
jgi:signal transduction histidine kinase